jgi:hypothetical protein
MADELRPPWGTNGHRSRTKDPNNPVEFLEDPILRLTGNRALEDKPVVLACLQVTGSALVVRWREWRCPSFCTTSSTIGSKSSVKFFFLSFSFCI